ncbi:MAG: DNA methylase, partial [Gammaproteobacteria bacterium]|nr:DNA methylase [Gammaproteobacteria bacterium]
KDIKSYRPESTSISSGQVLSKPYSFDMGLTIIKEMTDLIVLDLVEKDLLTDQIILNIGYDISNLEDEYGYNGEVVNDYVGRRVPKGAHGSINLEKYTSSTKLIMDKTIELYKRIVNPRLSIRRLNIALVHTVDRRTYNDNANLQMDLFNERVDEEKEEELLEKENKLQKTVIEIHKKYGKNALLKGFNILEESTSKDRNDQIGGHKK